MYNRCNCLVRRSMSLEVFKISYIIRGDLEEEASNRAVWLEGEKKIHVLAKYMVFLSVREGAFFHR